ncbi:MAG: indolepyruvate oxidoreductase subunit beta [Candidatus Saelkia tenebricola]|nr:indolepyruvate oxidoreductase subunit beta [Candidatus Saelkia tenebricola]
MMNKTVNILFCGTGGQGVLKASELSAWALVLEGYHVKKSEVHGMAQRGGSVESHLRFGKYVFSPLIPKGEVDFLVSLHENEYRRLEDFLHPEGRGFLPYLKKAEKMLKDKRYLNTFMVAVLSKSLPVSEKNWIKALKHIFPVRFFEENKRVFFMARDVVEK